MTTALNETKTALVAALLFGGWHVLWSCLVATGLGQRLWDFVLWAHMIHMPVTVGPFEPVAALTLVAFTSAFGYCLGFAFAWLWNRVHRH